MAEQRRRYYYSFLRSLQLNEANNLPSLIAPRKPFLLVLRLLNLQHNRRGFHRTICSPNSAQLQFLSCRTPAGESWSSSSLPNLQSERSGILVFRIWIGGFTLGITNRDLKIEMDVHCKGKSYTRTLESMHKIDTVINTI